MLATLAAEALLTPFQAFVLGAIQGLTELLPISSSAHLYLVPTVLGWRYEGVEFDVALHAGTVLALVVAFWGDWLAMARAPFDSDPARRREGLALLGVIVLGTIPALLVALWLKDWADQLRSVPLQATMLLVFGLLLWAADRFTRRAEDVRVPKWPLALGVGAAQALALVPGVSRSGITLTAGRVAGLSRVSAARFSFLLSTPITLAAVVYEGMSHSDDLLAKVPAGALFVGVASSALFGFLAIRFMLGAMRRIGFGVFALYRVAVAIALFAWAARH